MGLAFTRQIFLIIFMDMGGDAFMRPIGVSIFRNILYFVISYQLNHQN